MAILPIVEVPDPRLRQISSPVEDVNDEVRALIADMFETMYDAPGIGLAAIQVGVPIRVLVMDLQEPALAIEADTAAGPAFRVAGSGGLTGPVVFAWAAVCLPIAWGIYQTLIKAAVLLK